MSALEPQDPLLDYFRGAIDTAKLAESPVCLDVEIAERLYGYIKGTKHHLGKSLVQCDRATVTLAKVLFQYGELTQEELDNHLAKSQKAKEDLLEFYGLECLEGSQPRPKDSDN